LDGIADSIRNSELTALMNQDDTQLSKDMGSAFDVVIGFRNLFGVRRLGLDLRYGWFFPGKAFRIEEGDPADPVFRGADKGNSVVAKFWY
jgi:alginate production protein